MVTTSIDNHSPSQKWLLLALLFTVLFFSLGVVVKYTSVFDALNHATVTFLVHHHTPITDTFFVSVTLLCESPFYYVLAVALSVWLMLNRQPLLILHFFITVSAIYYISPFLKYFFEIVRPGNEIMHISYAFPSGHALIACVACGFWSLVFTQHLAGRKKYWMLLVYNILPIVVGVSRLYLGVHWITDVMGGFLVGWAIISLSFSIHSPQRNIKPDKWFFIIMSLALLVVVYLINSHLNEKLRFYEQVARGLQ